MITVLHDATVCNCRTEDVVMQNQNVTNQRRLAWSLKKIAEQTDLSVPFLRKEIRLNKLKAKKFGARVLVLDKDLRQYLNGDEETDGE